MNMYFLMFLLIHSYSYSYSVEFVNNYTQQMKLKLVQANQSISRLMYTPDYTSIIYQTSPNDLYCFHIQSRILINKDYQRICFKDLISVIQFNQKGDYLFIVTYQDQIYGFSYDNGIINQNYKFYYQYDSKLKWKIHSLDFISNKIVLNIGLSVIILNISYETFQLTLYHEYLINYCIMNSVVYVPSSPEYLIFSSQCAFGIINTITQQITLFDNNQTTSIIISPNQQYILRYSYDYIARCNILSVYSFENQTLTLIKYIYNETKDYCQDVKLQVSDDSQYLAFNNRSVTKIFKVYDQNQTKFIFENILTIKGYPMEFSSDSNQILNYVQNQNGQLQRWTYCKDGQYLFNQKCQKCSSSCLTCMKFTDFCLSCKKTELLHKNKCISCNQNQINLNGQCQCLPDYEFIDGKCTQNNNWVIWLVIGSCFVILIGILIAIIIIKKRKISKNNNINNTQGYNKL